MSLGATGVPFVAGGSDSESESLQRLLLGPRLRLPVLVTGDTSRDAGGGISCAPVSCNSGAGGGSSTPSAPVGGGSAGGGGGLSPL